MSCMFVCMIFWSCAIVERMIGQCVVTIFIAYLCIICCNPDACIGVFEGLCVYVSFACADFTVCGFPVY